MQLNRATSQVWVALIYVCPTTTRRCFVGHARKRAYRGERGELKAQIASSVLTSVGRSNEEWFWSRSKGGLLKKNRGMRSRQTDQKTVAFMRIFWPAIHSGACSQKRVFSWCHHGTTLGVASKPPAGTEAPVPLRAIAPTALIHGSFPMCLRLFFIDKRFCRFNCQNKSCSQARNKNDRDSVYHFSFP